MEEHKAELNGQPNQQVQENQVSLPGISYVEFQTTRVLYQTLAAKVVALVGQGSV